MTKDILLKIKGLQFLEENSEEQVEVITPASYFHKDGKHYIKYDEVMEGFDGSIQNLIKVNDRSLEVTKRGLANVHMILRKIKERDLLRHAFWKSSRGNIRNRHSGQHCREQD